MPGVQDFASVDLTRSDQATITVKVPTSVFDAVSALSMPSWLQGIIDLVPPAARGAIFSLIGGDPLDKLKADVRAPLDELNKFFAKYPIVIPFPKVPGGSGGSPGEPPAVFDPLGALKQLAEAINAAEGELNKFNLLIASGTVDATLVVGFGPAAANATVKLAIAPRQIA